MRAAFADIVDYAGLFPPATCTMADAVRQYDAYRRSPDQWMLGRFVVAAIRLQDLAVALETTGVTIDPDTPWRLAVVLGAVLPAELGRIAAFEGEWESRAVVVEAIEHRVTSPGQVQSAGELIPGRYRRYFEVPGVGPYRELLRAIHDAGAFAKIRTGGTTADLFPTPADLTTFLMASVKERVQFKATAGLHHPFRGSYPLTYAPDADRHVMYGFVNLLVAATELARGGDGETAQVILEETDRDSFVLSADGVAWRDQRYPTAELVLAHEQFFLSFGSCSFREPHDELGLERVA